MAKPQVTLTLAADSSQVERAFDRVGKAANDMERETESSGGGLARLGEAARTVGKAGAGLAAGLGPAAAVVVALGGVAASFASAGAAAQAFKLAVVPQLEDVTNAAELYAAAQEAAAAGGEEAAAAMAEYKAALAGMPPATRATATAFVGLKSDFQSWSDSLAGTTMPVFTKGIGILRDLLPQLTPFVVAAGTALSGFMDKIAVGVKSAGFKEFLTDMSAAAGPTLTNFLAVVQNVAIGIGGIVQAMLPANTGMKDITGNVVGASEAFARWGAGLKDSAAFGQFTEMARNGGAALGTFAQAAGKLLIALSPLLGTTTMLVLAMANLVSAIPTPVLTVLAGVIGTVTLGLKMWALYQTLATTATKVATAAQWLWNTALSANPIGLIIIAIVGLVAGIVLLWQKNEAFRNFIKGAWNVIWGAIKFVWDWTKKNWPYLLGILTGPIGMATVLIVKNWDKVKGAGIKVWNWIKDLPSNIGKALGKIASILYAPWKAGFNLIARGWNNTIGKLRISVPWWVPGFGGSSWSMPRIPYLAKGGVIQGSGLAVVGERGPEMVHLPRGATVSPLGRGGGTVRVIIDVRGADSEMKRMIRRMIRINGRGDVQVGFGGG